MNATITPSLLVRDIGETLAFYGDLLGFRLTGRYPADGAACWIEMRRDEAVMQFYSDPPGNTPTSPVMSGTIYIAPVDVNALAVELEGKVALAWGPEVMAYGRLECAVRDPNGYYIAFSQAVEGQ